jgi:hypothetical protein
MLVTAPDSISVSINVPALSLALRYNSGVSAEAVPEKHEKTSMTISKAGANRLLNMTTSHFPSECGPDHNMTQATICGNYFSFPVSAFKINTQGYAVGVNYTAKHRFALPGLNFFYGAGPGADRAEGRNCRRDKNIIRGLEEKKRTPRQGKTIG